MFVYVLLNFSGSFLHRFHLFYSFIQAAGKHDKCLLGLCVCFFGYNAKGEGVRIKDLGKVVERFAPPTIERKDRERIVTVSAVISGAPLGDVVAAGNAIIDKLEKPSDITIQVSGSFEDQQDSFRDLGTLGVLIIVLVFIVMAAQFESLTYPFILILSVPFAMSGVLMALFITNTTLSVMSLPYRR